MTAAAPELWRRQWRAGVAPALSTPGLEALARGLRRDDPALLQGMTAYPDYLRHARAWGAHDPCEGACAIAYAAWKGDGVTDTGAVSGAFLAVCHRAESALGVPGAPSAFLDWYDRTPRGEMRAALLPEVELELARRGVGVAP
jgi:hypothetical protein